jgi:predicted NAD-dependent protein-ADP-ribosyltransferase YbiA (DUF1768 family)
VGKCKKSVDKMANKNVLKFFGRSKEGKELSNFYISVVVVDGREYNCGESAFHGSKYIVVSDMKDMDMEIAAN